MTLPPPLQEGLQRQTFAIFIGADLPRTLTGLPSRAELAHDLARRHGLEETLSLAEVAQRISQFGSRFEFTDFLRSALDTTGLSPRPFHQRLAALIKAQSIKTIITTAYDDLLELACQQIGLSFSRVIRGSDVAFIRPDRPAVFKLYGDAQQPDTLVVTDRDHSTLLYDRNKEELIDEVRGAFRRNTILFLGYNLADADFRFLFDQIAESRFARTAYAVWPGLPEADVHMWRERGIVILEADPLESLGSASAPSAPPVQSAPISAAVAKLEAALVRIHGETGPVGVGFLVGEQHVLTCAHVVAAALSISATIPDSPTQDVTLDWPLLSASQKHTAQVTLWVPARPDGGDIVGFTLNTPPPRDAQPIKLLETDDIWGHPFRAFGFPKGYADGVWASGVLRGRQATGWVQIEDVKEAGYRVQPGFSGGPVWDDILNGVVGMVVAADTQTEVKAALIIPSRLIRAAWPAITRA